LSLGGPKGLQALKKVLQHNIEQLETGEISLQEFLKKTKPAIERSEFES